MIPLENARVVKGMAFAGCSFTWGQGLYYYSHLPTLKEPKPDHYVDAWVTEGQRRYMASVRYPRLVANHFKTWEIVHPFNGGSNQSIIEWFASSFKEMDQSVHPSRTHKTYDYSEISHLFLQLTQYPRNNFNIDIDGQVHNVGLNVVSFSNNDEDKHWQELFRRWLTEKGWTFEDWEKKYIDDNVAQVKSFLEEFERNGVRTAMISWPSEYLTRIDADPWLHERHMHLYYNGNSYACIEHMMTANRELEIKYDHTNFIDTPKDHHPSMLCHRVLADNIINRIESQGYQ